MYKAIGMYIFGGSQTIGHLQTGWDVKQILEMTDNMDKCNAYHFIKNYPEIPVIPPNQWQSDEYLNNLAEEHYDFLFANNPCSGLSRINQNAKADNKINSKFYDVVDVIKRIKPKAFLIENAPTLINIGLPILKEIIKLLADNYFITIISDAAGRHGVPMLRKRTLLVGYNKYNFEYMPIIKNYQSEFKSIEEVIASDSSLPNMEPVKRKYSWIDLSRYYNLVKPNKTIIETVAEHYDELKDELDKKEAHVIKQYLYKKSKKPGIWDKSAKRLIVGKFGWSMTSMSVFIHPTEDRELYVREYAKIMGYPDDFIFYQDDECQVDVIQCLAQGVPVNFIKYISNEIMQAFENNRTLLSDASIIYQNNINNYVNYYDIEQFINCENITLKQTYSKIF